VTPTDGCGTAGHSTSLKNIIHPSAMLEVGPEFIRAATGFTSIASRNQHSC
jgi:hypothetical protein